MGIDQVKYILDHLPNDGGLLVWGLGNDSPFWDQSTSGRVVFLEDDTSDPIAGVHWQEEILKKYPLLEAYQVHYTTEVLSSYDRYLNRSDLWHQELDVRPQLPANVTNAHWDVIIIDGPLGCCDTGPGRYQSIYTSKLLASISTHIFVDDYDRPVEQQFSKMVFGDGPVKVVDRPAGVYAANQQAHFVASWEQKRFLRKLKGDRAAYESFVANVLASVLAPSRYYEHLSYPAKGLTMQSANNLKLLQAQIESIVDTNVDGDVYKTGIWRAGTAIFMTAVFRAYESFLGIEPKRHFYFFDSFEGFKGSGARDDNALDTHLSSPNYVAPLQKVRTSFRECGLDPDDSMIHFVKGWFEETIPKFTVPRKISLLRLDGDLYSSTLTALEHLHAHVTVGGWVIVDDYHWRPNIAKTTTKLCKEAVDEFRNRYSVGAPLTSLYGPPSWQILDPRSQVGPQM